MDNPVCSRTGDNLDREMAYPAYNRDQREISSNEGSSHNLTLGYHRSSSSSSSGADSGKQLVRSQSHRSHHVPTSVCGGRRLEKSNNREDVTFHYQPERNLRDGSSSSPSPRVHKTPKFFIGPPSSPGSSKGCRSSIRSSSSSPEMPSSPDNNRRKTSQIAHPGFSLQLNPSRILTPPNKNSKISSLYDAYWHIPRASLWCTHKACLYGNERCSLCQLKDETSSNCSSENPPPTFTALDNYHPIRKKRHQCSCGAVSLATLIFSTLVLLLIAAFIIYIEMVLKRKEYIPDPM